MGNLIRVIAGVFALGFGGCILIDIGSDAAGIPHLTQSAKPSAGGVYVLRRIVWAECDKMGRKRDRNQGGLARKSIRATLLTEPVGSHQKKHQRLQSLLYLIQGV